MNNAYPVISLENCEEFIERYGQNMIDDGQEYPIQIFYDIMGSENCAIDGEYTLGIDHLHNNQILHFKKIIVGYELDFSIWDYELVANEQGGLQYNIYAGKVSLYISGQEMVNLRYYWHNINITALTILFTEFIWGITLYQAIKYDKAVPLIGKHLGHINNILMILLIIGVIATIGWFIYSYRHYLHDRKILKNAKLTKYIKS